MIDDPVPNALGTSVAGVYSPRAITQFGFSNVGNIFKCVPGEITVYAKDHTKLLGKRGLKELEYDFLCALEVGGSDIHVWIADFPSLLLFFREVEVRSENDVLNRVLRAVIDSEVLVNLSFAMKDMSAGDVEIHVK